MFELKNVKYMYDKNKVILEDVNYKFEDSRVYTIVGNSGSGKTTILSLLAGLDSPSSGSIEVNGVDIREKGSEYHRKNQISLVFQNYNLINYMTALENVRLVNGKASKDLLLDLGLQEDEINRNVTRLSGGQQQRVAIARALAAPGNIVLADEPTGNLDEDTADDIMDMFISLAHDKGKCVIIVTHSKKIAKASDVILKLSNKKLVEGN